MTLEAPSDVNDPFGNLARAALLISTDAFQVRADFEFEPGEMRLEVRRESANDGSGWCSQRRLDVFDRMLNGSSDAPPIFTTCFKADNELSRAVVNALRELRASETNRTSYGPRGFPEDAVYASTALSEGRQHPS